MTSQSLLTDASNVFERVKGNLGTECKGIYSHYATADEGDLSFANRNFSLFNGSS